MPETRMRRALRRLPTLHLLVLGLLVVHAASFLTGFRLTSDDVMYGEIFAKGPDYLRQRAWNSAANQGRLGFLLLQPLNYIAAYYAEFLTARLLYVGLYFLQVVLAFYLLAKLFRQKTAAFFLLIFLAVHPQAYEHLPPNAYPLQNTVPFLLVLSLHLLLARDRALSAWATGAAYGGLLIGYFSVEYAWLLGCGIFAVQLGERIPLSGVSLGGALRQVATTTALRRHLLVLIVTVVGFLLSKAVLPSTYDGNQVPAALDLAGAGKTVALHIVDGTTARRFFRISWDLSLVDYAGIAVAGLAYLWLMLRLLGSLSVDTADPERNRRFVMRVLALTAAAVVVTLPLAITDKQIGWCANNMTCAYLDSRTSALFVVALIGLAALHLLQVVGAGQVGRLVRFGFSALFAMIFAATLLHNRTIANQMQVLDDSWRAARDFACFAPYSGVDRSRFGALVDPDGRLPARDAAKRQEVWADYIDRLADSGHCATGPWSTIPDFVAQSTPQPADPLDLLTGTSARMSEAESAVYLGSGWAAQESWGVWSVDSAAVIQFMPRGMGGEDKSIWLNFGLNFRDQAQAQRVIVEAGGVEVAQATYSADAVGDSRVWLEVPIPAQSEGTLVELVLRFPDAVAQQGGTGRRLGVALVRINFGTGP